MKIVCKDQATKDLLLKAIDEFPQSFGHIAKLDIVVFGPDTLDIMLDKQSSVTMADYDTIKQLYNMEVDARDHFMNMDEFTRARLTRMDKDQLLKHYCGVDAPSPRANEIMLRITNTPDNTDWPERLEKVLNPTVEMDDELHRRIQIYLTSIVDARGYVNVTEEVLLELEKIAEVTKKPRIAIVGGLGLGARLLSEVITLDERAFMMTNHSGDFGRESGKKSRRPMVTSASGHPYPLPKGPRGMPRSGRTRGR